VLAAAALSLALAGCSSTPTTAPGKVAAVGAENEYANVIGQIGGRYVSVTAVMTNPNADPHSFESSPQVASIVSGAELVVQNGAGYDDFMTKIEQAVPSSGRKVIDVQGLLGLSAETPNPHLWYAPGTMPKVAEAIAHVLSKLEPSHKAFFAASLARFDKSLEPWLREMAAIRSRFAGAKVAVTEPVADYSLTAEGLDDVTPFPLQADVMNGVDPAPEDVTFEENLLSKGDVKVFVYNRQVTDSFTESLLAIAGEHHVPVVGMYETMPVPGFSYQSWMLAEATAIYRALAEGKSSPSL
jgi:zinc/manganese transport system substrate-binding protein